MATAPLPLTAPKPERLYRLFTVLPNGQELVWANCAHEIGARACVEAHNPEIFGCRLIGREVVAVLKEGGDVIEGTWPLRVEGGAA